MGGQNGQMGGAGMSGMPGAGAASPSAFGLPPQLLALLMQLRGGTPGLGMGSGSSGAPSMFSPQFPAPPGNAGPQYHVNPPLGGAPAGGLPGGAAPLPNEASRLPLSGAIGGALAQLASNPGAVQQLARMFGGGGNIGGMITRPNGNQDFWGGSR